MFEDSTKAIIISSSHIKGPGPRIGSIGYAIPYQESYRTKFLPSDTQFINGLVLFSIRMTFIRYGYEKERLKYEVKNLIGVVPIINELRKNSDSERILKIFVEKFPKSNFDSHLWLKAKLDLTGKTDNIDVCILAPVNTYDSDLRVCSNMEFNAWFRNFMFRDHTRMSIFRIIHDDIYLNKLPEGQLIHIAKMLRIYFKSKTDGDTFINYIIGSADRREELIRLLKLIKSSYSKNILPEHKRFMTRLLAEGRYDFKRGSHATNLLFCRLLEFMFVDKIFNWKLDLLATKAPMKNRTSIAAKLKRIKEVLESMANEINRK